MKVTVCMQSVSNVTVTGCHLSLHLALAAPQALPNQWRLYHGLHSHKNWLLLAHTRPCSCQKPQTMPIVRDVCDGHLALPLSQSICPPLVTNNRPLPMSCLLNITLGPVYVMDNRSIDPDFKMDNLPCPHHNRARSPVTDYRFRLIIDIWPHRCH